MKRCGIGTVAMVAGLVATGAEQAPAQEPARPPVEYVGKAPANKKLRVLAEHRVIARFEETPYKECRGLTGACPDRCGSSGEFATFTITDYLHYRKLGKYGDDKQKTYYIQISDFHRKPKGDPAMLAVVKQLKKGNLVLIEWNHLYGEIRPRSSAPVRPLLHLKKIDDDEAKRLKSG